MSQDQCNSMNRSVDEGILGKSLCVREGVTVGSKTYDGGRAYVVTNVYSQTMRFLGYRCDSSGYVFVRVVAEDSLSAEQREDFSKRAEEGRRKHLASAETQYVDKGVRIHRVLFVEADSRIVVKEMPEDARTTLRIGDRLLGCHGTAAKNMTVRNLYNCRSETGAYTFVVERDAQEAWAVLER